MSEVVAEGNVLKTTPLPHLEIQLNYQRLPNLKGKILKIFTSCKIFISSKVLRSKFPRNKLFSNLYSEKILNKPCYSKMSQTSESYCMSNTCAILK